MELRQGGPRAHNMKQRRKSALASSTLVRKTCTHGSFSTLAAMQVTMHPTTQTPAATNHRFLPRWLPADDITVALNRQSSTSNTVTTTDSIPVEPPGG